MDGFMHTLSAIPAGTTRRTYGTAFWDGTEWLADVDGSLLSCRWADPIQPLQGGNIVVDITKDEYGQASALVLCGYTEQPRPSTGAILAIGVDDIVINGEDGVSYTTKRYLGPIGGYVVGDKVYITWDAAIPTILGKINEITITPSAPAPPPAQIQGTGKETLVAIKSNTYWGPGGWGSWATSQFGGEDVYSGTWGGSTVTGAWFYGTARPALEGKTITLARFRLPARLPVGSSGSATVHLYAHTSSHQPGGDVARTVGPFDVSVVQGNPPKWVTLPSSFHAVLAAGGGISIAGDPYVGFESRLDDPESGKLIMNWSV